MVCKILKTRLVQNLFTLICARFGTALNEIMFYTWPEHRNRISCEAPVPKGSFQYINVKHFVQHQVSKGHLSEFKKLSLFFLSVKLQHNQLCRWSSDESQDRHPNKRFYPLWTKNIRQGIIGKSLNSDLGNLFRLENRDFDFSRFNILFKRTTNRVI